jgi:hypothetical protein
VNNGSVGTVTGFTAGGGVVLAGGRVLDGGYGHLTHGYCATSHAAQGKTVDVVLVCQGAVSLPASSPEQFYVSVSRARERVTVYTDDRGALREAVSRSRPRPSATELVAPAPSPVWRVWAAWARKQRGRRLVPKLAPVTGRVFVTRAGTRRPADEVGR